MRLILLTAPGSDTAWLADLACEMGWSAEADNPGAAEPLARRIRQVNERIFAATQSTWYHVEALPGSAGDSLPELPYAVTMDIEACAGAMNREARLLCDDPALCVLLPWWRPRLTDTLYVVHVEHPLTVSHRLRDEWRFPVAFGLALWEFYLRTAIHHTRGHPRLLVMREAIPGEPLGALRAAARQLARYAQSGCPDEAAIGRIGPGMIPAPAEYDADFLALARSTCLPLYDALAAGDIEQGESAVTSTTANDMLQMYGRLRAGSDAVRAERDDLRRRLRRKPPPSSPRAEMPAHPRRAAADSVVDVSLHLRDREPLEFSCRHDDPVLDQLIRALGRAGTGETAAEVFYLELGDTTVYFPLSELTGVETDHDVHGAMDRLTPPLLLDPAGSRETMDSPVGDAPRRNVAVVVLGCLLPQYERCLDVIESTWASKRVAGIDVYYTIGAHIDPTVVTARGIEKYLGHAAPPLTAFEARLAGNVIVCGCADTINLQGDSLLRKRLIAFNHLARTARYDFIYTVCASSYVDQACLRDYVESLDGSLLFHGPVGVCEFTGRPYVSGASMLFSIDMIERLVPDTHRILEDNHGHYADDVALGSWIARHVSDTNETRIVENIRAGRRATGDHTFVTPSPVSTIDFVNVDAGRQLPVEGAYHYHFRTDVIEQMTDFHHRYFA